MKKLKSFTMMLPRITAVFCILALATMSCQKDASIPTQPDLPLPDDTTSAQKPDPVNDLIAFLDPPKSVLYVEPDYKEQVFELLGVTQLGAGKAVVPVTNPQRTSEFEAVVEVIPAPSSHIAEIATSREDTPDPDLIKQFEEKGSWYRMFKNARCPEKTPYREGKCKKNEDGSSTLPIWHPWGNCLRGTGFCTEVWSVYVEWRTYTLGDCQGPFKVTKYTYNWNCY